MNTSVLEHTGEWVNVSWSGVPTPGDEDWVGVYSPPVNGNTVDPAAHAPVKYQVCTLKALCQYISSNWLLYLTPDAVKCVIARNVNAHVLQPRTPTHR